MIKQFDWKFSTDNKLFADLKITELPDNKKPMTNSFEDSVNEYLRTQDKYEPEHIINFRLQKLFNLSKTTPVESTKEKRTYHIEVDDNTHWALVSIAAKQKLHQEDFVENLLVEFVAEWRAVHEATS